MFCCMRGNVHNGTWTGRAVTNYPPLGYPFIICLPSTIYIPCPPHIKINVHSCLLSV